MSTAIESRLERRETEETATPAVIGTPAFRVGRALLGGVLAFMALDNFRNREESVAYARSKGAPMPEVSVPVVSGLLLSGGLGIALWRYPRAAAAAAASFFVSVTPVMHDFWTLDDPEERQQQMIHFLKNTALLGATLALFALGRRE